MPNRVVSVALFALTLAVGCKKGEGQEAVPQTCRDIQNDVCVEPTDKFGPTVPTVHMTYTTADLPKNGDAYEIKWIAEDVGEAAPANTEIDTVVEKVDDVVPETRSYTINSRLTRPTDGWPPGRYRVEVKRGDQLVTTARFSIAAE